MSIFFEGNFRNTGRCWRKAYVYTERGVKCRNQIARPHPLTFVFTRACTNSFAFFNKIQNFILFSVQHRVGPLLPYNEPIRMKYHHTLRYLVGMVKAATIRSLVYLWSGLNRMNKRMNLYVWHPFVWQWYGQRKSITIRTQPSLLEPGYLVKRNVST
jgi:hypothetical protein